MINLTKKTLAILLVVIIGIGSGIGVGIFIFIFSEENPPDESPGAFTLSSDADDPDDDGKFTLTWGAADGAMNYSVYEYSSYITVINSSLTTLATSITNLSRSLTGYTNGTYYFIVVAHNAQGDTLSNCHKVIVAVPPEISITPGVPDGVDSDHILRIGIPGDVGEITGDGAYEGAYLAAKEINEAGGMTVGTDTYYFGLVREDTDEDNPNLVTSIGVAAAEKLVYDNNIQFAIGGSRTEAVLAYQEVFMDNDIIFMSTGVAPDNFTENVRNYYDRYKYYFRVMPTNSTTIGGQMFSYFATLIGTLNAIYGAGTVHEIGVLAEDLTWTESTTEFLSNYIPYMGCVIPEDCLIRYDINLSTADMNTHMQTMIDNGVDLLIPVISGQGGIMMMQQYAALQPNFTVVGIDLHSQLDTFWAQSGGACAYETVMQALYNVNKTPTTIPFWDAFRAEWGHDPLYTAIGAYDAVNNLAWAIETGQTIDNDELIPVLEEKTLKNITTNPSAFPVSPSGSGAWWPASHEVVGGFPYGYTLWVQWTPYGTKQVVPGSDYGATYIAPCGEYLVPPWVHTAWTAEESALITPGVPDGVDSDHILRIGIPGDVGEITGDGAYEGAYLAAKEINEAGGMAVGTDTYYFGLVKEDTDEDNPNLVTSIGVAAAEKLVYDNNIQFAVGGSREEAVLAYQEVFMDNDIIFMSTGVAPNIFTDNVRNYYDRYKYYFRVIPTNSTTVGGQMFYYFATLIGTLNAIYGAGTIHEIGVLAEDLTWTESMTDFLSNYIPYTGCVIPEDCLIRYDIALTPADMNTHMQTMIDNGVDLLIPVISGQGGIMMMQQYAALQPNFTVVGIDLHSQLDTFWAQSGGACAYETVMQALYNVNKTPTTIPFWGAFRAEWGHDPLYTAIGAYDAVNNLAWAIETGQTIDNDELIPVLENKTRANILANPSAFPSSPTGLGAWWPASHEVVGGFPYGYTLWVQWTPYGTKQVVPGFDYGTTYIAPCGEYLVPPWVHTAWTAEESALITPGVPDGVDSDHILRIGIPGDVGEITGDGAYEGAYLAAKEINEAGGMIVGIDTYFFGLVREDTEEDNPNFLTSIGVLAAEKLVYDNNIQFAIGGSRTEAVLAYQEVFMDNDIIFMSTGVTTNIFTDNVRNYYDRYKYYFRVMPTNLTTVGVQMFSYLANMIATMNNIYGVGTVHEIGVLAEDLTWTESMTNFLATYIPYTGCVIPEGCLIRYDINLSVADMNTHMQTMIDNGVDLLIPVISGQGGIMMMQQYAALQPNFTVVGIDVHSQLDTFWAQSGGACAYETVMQELYNVNKTPTTIPFWAAFRAEWGHDPLYTATGAYDAVNNLAWAIETGQTIDNDELIPVLENKTRANILANPSAFPSSPNGLGAWWPASHEVVGGFPYGYTLWVQWKDNGTKQVVPGYDYGDTYIAPCGEYLVPPWVYTAWTLGESALIIPGVPDGVDSDHIRRIGIPGDVGKIARDCAYDRVTNIVKCIKTTQSLNVDNIITYWKTWTTTGSNPTAIGVGDWWRNNHDLVKYYSFGYEIIFQWQNGISILLPSWGGIYTCYGMNIAPMGIIQTPLLDLRYLDVLKVVK